MSSMKDIRPASTALDGRTVTLTLMQDGNTFGPLLVAEWKRSLVPTPGMAVTVEVTRSAAQTAPEGVFFKVTDWTGFETQAGDVAGYDGRQMDLIHVWSFGDPGASHQVPERVLPEWRDANTARGPFVAHVYEGFGDHDWSLTVIEPSTGRIATTSGRITVADPDVTFAGTATAYVSNSSDFSDCPASIPANQRFTKISDAVVFVGPNVTGGRVMLARGQDFAVGSDGETNNLDGIGVGAGQDGPIHIVGGPGTGAKPRLVATTDFNVSTIGWIWFDYRGREYVVSDVAYKGNWDSTTETGDSCTGNSIATNALTLFNRCTYDGCNAWSSVENDRDPVTGASAANDAEKAANRLANEAKASFIANKCLATNGSSYACYATAIGKLAWLGSQMTHHVDARSGGPRGGYSFNSSGAVRVPSLGPADGFVDCCDFFTRSGWYSNTTLTRTIQPNFRWNTNGVAGCFLNVQRSSFEGGNTMLSGTRQNAGEPGVVSPMLLEHLILVASHMTSIMIEATGTGFALRNVLAIVPDTPHITSDFRMRHVIRANYVVGFGSDSTAQFPEIYLPKAEASNVTLVNLTSVANGNQAVNVMEIPDYNPNPYGPIVDANNLVHEPNLSVPKTAFAPLDQTPLWEARDKGPINSSHFVDTVYPSRFHRGDVIVMPWPAGTTAATFWPAGEPNKSFAYEHGSPPPTMIEHTAEGYRITNTGTEASHDKEAGAQARFELDRRMNPLSYPQYAIPAGSVWASFPATGSAAIAAATGDGPREDLRGRMRPATGKAVGALEPA